LRLILESKISKTSNSFSPSNSIRGGGIWNLPSIDDSLYGLNKETWNKGWIFIEGGSSRQNATSLICLITEKGPRWQKSNLLHRRLSLRLRQSNHTLSQMLIIDFAFRDLFALSFCQSWALRSLFFISILILDNQIARSLAVGFSTLLKLN
jgi:hypothetical protein